MKSPPVNHEPAASNCGSSNSGAGLPINGDGTSLGFSDSPTKNSATSSAESPQTNRPRSVSAFPAASATPIRQVIVSELGRPGRVVLDAAEAGREWFGHVVEARAFGQAVLENH